MSRATEASLSEARKKRKEEQDRLEATRNTGAKTSSSTYHRSGLKRSAYGENKYS